jgi:hypothetical protein
MGDQVVEAGAEGDRRDHDDRGQRGAQDGRPRRHRVAAGAGIEGEADSLDGGCRQARAGGRARRARSPLPGPRPSHGGAVRGLPVSQRHRHRGQAGDQHQHAQAQDCPVEGDARIGIDRAHQADRGQRRQARRHNRGQQRPGPHCSQKAGQLVADRDGRARAEGTQHFEVPGAQPQLAADHLTGDQQSSQGGDPPEHAQCDRLWPEGPLGLGLGQRGDVEHDRKAPRQDLCVPRIASTALTSRVARPAFPRDDHRSWACGWCSS